MGYACPVCDAPQADAGHLADHLAITAIARGGEHETWLDDRVPGWANLEKPALAERVVERAEETEYPQVFEDTAADAGTPEGNLEPAAMERRADDATAADLEAVLEEARELTERRREDSETE